MDGGTHFQQVKMLASYLHVHCRILIILGTIQKSTIHIKIGFIVIIIKGAHMLTSRKVIHIKLGFIIIKGQGGTHAYKHKSQIQYKNGLITCIIIKGLGGTQA